MQKSKLIKLADETRTYYENRQEKRSSTEKQIKSADLANAIIRVICEVDGLTTHIIKNALIMTEEIVETIINNDVIS